MIFYCQSFRYRKNRQCSPKRILFIPISKRKIGDQNFPSICFSLQRKTPFLATTFFHLATGKKIQSPVGACLKKLISDPEVGAIRGMSHSYNMSWSVLPFRYFLAMCNVMKRPHFHFYLATEFFSMATILQLKVAKWRLQVSLEHCKCTSNPMCDHHVA